MRREAVLALQRRQRDGRGCRVGGPADWPEDHRAHLGPGQRRLLRLAGGCTLLRGVRRQGQAGDRSGSTVGTRSAAASRELLVRKRGAHRARHDARRGVVPLRAVPALAWPFRRLHRQHLAEHRFARRGQAHLVPVIRPGPPGILPRLRLQRVLGRRRPGLCLDCGWCPRPADRPRHRAAHLRGEQGRLLRNRRQRCEIVRHHGGQPRDLLSRIAMRAMISMYDMPERRPAIEAWWAGLTRHWQAAGLRDVPETTQVTDGDLYELWQAPDLFIAQTCGFPLTHRLKDRVTLVGTPVYALNGCSGGSYHSVIVARKDSDVHGLDDVAGTVAAINGYDSQSGWNALRHSLIGKGAPARVVETGGHRRSVAAVREGRADVAVIDCVTYAGLQQLATQEVAPLRIIAHSASAPALPYVTRRDIAPADLEKLRAGLRAAMTDPALAETRAALLLSGLEIVPLQAYDRLLEMEREADRADSLVDRS